METRCFGRTGHLSTIAIFGAAAFRQVSQMDAGTVMEQVIEAGINHIDIAPSYGQAEACGSCGEGRAVLGTRQRKIQRKTIFVILGEPPDAAPHVRWCERDRLAAASYSI